MTGAEPWQVMPSLRDDEYAALKADIAQHGVRIPIVVDATTGDVLDGHHRARAWAELRAEGVKVPAYARDVRHFANDEDRLAFVVAANLFRRHLSRIQRAEVVARLREQGWSLRRIGGAVGVDDKTVRNDLTGAEISAPVRVEGSDQKSYPAIRPRPAPSIIVNSDRDQHRAEAALSALGETAPAKLIGLGNAEERVHNARMQQRRESVVPPRITEDSYELRLGDLTTAWADLPDGSVDAIVTDPPYDNQGVPLYEELGYLAARVLKPGRLAAVYCGHVHLDEEMALLAKGGLTYVWHGVNVLPGQHTKMHRQMINGRHRSVLLFSAGPFKPRKWIHDAYWAEGRGGPDTRPDHPWQQSIGTMRHWVWMTSEPGEVVFDPFLGSGTCAVAALSEGRRFLGGDLDPGCVETTRLRLVELAEQNESEGA
ncbi:MAG: DNA methyltransferase [Acidimicrobiales bacterium]